MITIELTCPWNDHGDICARRGSFSESIVGGGPWYCREHWARLHNQSPPRAGSHVSARERWYQENNLPYEPPKLIDVPPFRCIGNLGPDIIYRRITDGKIGPRMREPGEDDE